MLGSLALHAAATPAASGEFDIFANLFESRGVVLIVLLVLMAMSLICWLIIGYKAFWLLRMRGRSRAFVEKFWQAPHPNDIYDTAKADGVAPESRVFVAAFRELAALVNQQKGNTPPTEAFENVERAVRRAFQDEVGRMERLVPILATTGSTAPFIGLFGTVWGIMKAFAGISQVDESTNLLTTVTPHIAEALVATAIGLLAAIPAVMAYNFFVSRIRKASTSLDGFATDTLNALRRAYFHK